MRKFKSVIAAALMLAMAAPIIFVPNSELQAKPADVDCCIEIDANYIEIEPFILPCPSGACGGWATVTKTPVGNWTSNGIRRPCPAAIHCACAEQWRLVTVTTTGACGFHSSRVDHDWSWYCPTRGRVFN